MPQNAPARHGGGAQDQRRPNPNKSRRRHRYHQSEVSCCLKYVIFGFNVIFWLLGLSIMAIGVWAWTEKDTFNNLSLLTNIALDPAFIFIWAGALTFVIGFLGCVGALRENTAFLAAYAIVLALLLLLEMTAGILGFIFKDWIKEQATSGFQTVIIHYRDDPDQQNLIDWIQDGWLQCCGIEGPHDWDKNVYFNCSSASVGSREACGVPFSCCKPQVGEFIKNVQCGYDVRKPDYPGDASTLIYDKGCLRSGEEWIERNLIPVAGVAVALAVLQSDPSVIINEKGCLHAAEEWLEQNLLIVAGSAVSIAFLEILGICFAQNLRADIFAQMSKWH